MSLLCPNGQPFATAAIKYSYRPATVSKTTNRIILSVEIEGISTNAVVDTGAPYVICEPRIARLGGFDRVEPLERMTMLIRGMRLDGSVIRLVMHSQISGARFDSAEDLRIFWLGC